MNQNQKPGGHRHSRSSGRVPGYSGSSYRSSKHTSRNEKSILGIASLDLSNTKTTILGATPGAIPGIDGNPNVGGCQKGGLGGCSPGMKTGTRVRSHVPPE